MAGRANVTKLLQELRGFAEVTNRRPVFGTAWAPIPPHVFHLVVLRRTLFVRGDPQNLIEEEVKIRPADEQK
jgi:hypothetical protein